MYGILTDVLYGLKEKSLCKIDAVAFSNLQLRLRYKVQ